MINKIYFFIIFKQKSMQKAKKYLNANKNKNSK